ncbi:hypothetical protein OHA27_37510 [Streptomyces sp. NBC_01619]|uniref:hypothetical protein n=1 Tax=Streptomyces sp. NBC_01619 TaxID=2975901 RepID=UPI00225B61DC|nr:hypothetical protein [Streptomyces sp. NBC_01619]MCX4515836.1 hypothetical protein [Streptomyces sp. NBC_01619]
MVRRGKIYNLGGGTDLASRQLAERILGLCGGAGWDSVTYVPDRPSNDIRYAMDWSKAATLGYQPAPDFDAGLAARGLVSGQPRPVGHRCCATRTPNEPRWRIVVNGSG